MFFFSLHGIKTNARVCGKTAISIENDAFKFVCKPTKKNVENNITLIIRIYLEYKKKRKKRET